jgi:hypothetical protein
MAVEWNSLDEMYQDLLVVDMKRGFTEDSTKTLIQGLEIFKDQVNAVDAKSDYDTLATIIDKRTTQTAIDEGAGFGNVYKVFSDAYVTKYGLDNWWVLEVDKVSVAKIGETVASTIQAKVDDGSLGTGGGQMTLKSGKLDYFTMKLDLTFDDVDPTNNSLRDTTGKFLLGYIDATTGIIPSFKIPNSSNFSIDMPTEELYDDLVINIKKQALSSGVLLLQPICTIKYVPTKGFAVFNNPDVELTTKVVDGMTQLVFTNISSFSKDFKIRRYLTMEERNAIVEAGKPFTMFLTMYSQDTTTTTKSDIVVNYDMPIGLNQKQSLLISGSNAFGSIDVNYPTTYISVPAVLYVLGEDATGYDATFDGLSCSIKNVDPIGYKTVNSPSRLHIPTTNEYEDVISIDLAPYVDGGYITLLLEVPNLDTDKLINSTATLDNGTDIVNASVYKSADYKYLVVSVLSSQFDRRGNNILTVVDVDDNIVLDVELGLKFDGTLLAGYRDSSVFYRPDSFVPTTNTDSQVSIAVLNTTAFTDGSDSDITIEGNAFTIPYAEDSIYVSLNVEDINLADTDVCGAVFAASQDGSQFVECTLITSADTTQFVIVKIPKTVVYAGDDFKIIPFNPDKSAPMLTYFVSVTMKSIDETYISQFDF